MKLKETKVSSHKIYAGKILDLYVDGIALPDGNPAVREYVDHSGGAAVLFINEGKVALVRQYRYAYGEETLEIPAGKLNCGEEAEEAAARELEEETGYKAEKLTHLFDIYPSPGYTNEVIHIYLALKAEAVGQRLDEDGFLNCELVPLERVVEMIEGGVIRDAKTVCAVYGYIAKNK